MQQPLRPTFVKIHLDHIAKNFDQFKALSSARHFFCPMIKANAYGHGDIQVAQKLTAQGCTTFGVGLVEEGLHLRKAGVTKPQILVFGFTGKEAVREMLQAQLVPVVSDFRQLETLIEALKISTRSARQSIHLKINTGMNRLGFTENEIDKLAATLTTHPQLQIVGCGTHLMTSEDLGGDTGSSYAQLQSFSQILKKLPLEKSCSLHAYNTSGAVYSHRRTEIAEQFPYGSRIGLGLYGYASVPLDQSLKLYPAMSFLSRIVTVQNVKKNGRVSYGGTWTATRDSRVGIVPAGYADGIPTQLSSKGAVQLGGVAVPIVGRVCMDYTLVDVTDMENAVDQEVEFFGTRLSAHTVAEKTGTITYDILTRISERVPRLYF